MGLSNPYYEDAHTTIYLGDALALVKSLPKDRIHLVVTSPPYNKIGHEGKRRKKHSRDTGQKRNIEYADFGDDIPEEEYQTQQIAMLNALYDVLVPGGSLFYNHKPRYKDFVCTSPLEWVLRTKLKLRQEIIWDRLTVQNINPIKFYSSTERLYWLFKGDKPRIFNPEQAKHKEVWSIPPVSKADHPAPFPVDIPKRAILACTNPGDTVLDPYLGTGTTALAAVVSGRKAIGIDITANYLDKAVAKLAAADSPKLVMEAA